MGMLIVFLLLILLCRDSHSDKSSAAPKTARAVKNTIGNKIQTVPYDSAGFDSKNGQATDPQDLSCSSNGPCCWKQAPDSTVDWLTGSGQIDAVKFKRNFRTTDQPSDGFLVASMDKRSKDNDKAELRSCLIQCSSDNVKVSMKHWSKGAKIRVCQATKSNPKKTIACQDLPSQGLGPDMADLPPADNVYIIVDAYNFSNATNNVAVIQDLTVSYAKCQTSTASTSTTSAAATSTTITTTVAMTSTSTLPDMSSDCVRIANDFNTTMGNYGLCDDAPKTFQLAGPQLFRNPATGVPKSPSNSKHAASYLKPGDKVCMQASTKMFLNRDYQIKFEEYESTEGASLKACCGDLSQCPYETGPKVDKRDHKQWYQGAILCKQGTDKVLFYAENKGPNEGGVGIGNIQVFDVSGTNRVC